MPIKTYFSWSTGKDSAIALYYLLQDKSYSVELLFTSVNAHHDRVSMHGLRRELLEKQIQAIGISSSTLELPESPSMDTYENITITELQKLIAKNYSCCAFGDIFLEDLRLYREKQLSQLNLSAHFPIWKRDTKELIVEFINLGFKAIVVCVNANLLDESFVGVDVSEDFINRLPSNVDPCGENGEFHTFCYDGPIFNNPISFEVGEKIYKEYDPPSGSSNKIGFWFCDIM